LGSEEIRHNLQANAAPVLAEWDPHPFGVMAEHVPLQAIVDLQVPITWVLGANSLPWLAKLQARVVSRRPDIHTVVIPGAGHLVHLDNPTEFIATVRAPANALPFLHERSRLSDSAFPPGVAGR
jgi:pimeloyl-ACP methyl ester carboxylesterase